MYCINIHLTVNPSTFSNFYINYAYYCTWLLHTIRVKRCTTSVFRYNFYGYDDVF